MALRLATALVGMLVIGSVRTEEATARVPDDATGRRLPGPEEARAEPPGPRTVTGTSFAALPPPPPPSPSPSPDDARATSHPVADGTAPTRVTATPWTAPVGQGAPPSTATTATAGPPGIRLMLRADGDSSWADLSAWLGLSEVQLRAWNPHIEGAPTEGASIHLWMEREAIAALRQRAANTRHGADIPPRTSQESRRASTPKAQPDEVAPMPPPPPAAQRELTGDRDWSWTRARSQSVGRANRGRLIGGVQLPADDPSFHLARPNEAWTTGRNARILITAIDAFHRSSSYDRPIALGSLSQRGGGRLRPHRSHQSGRDVDIRLPIKDHSRPLSYKASHRAEIDWRAAWVLTRLLLESDSIRYIFLERSGQLKLHRAAKRAGATEDELSRWFQTTPSGQNPRAIIRHAEGHVGHIHVRFGCASDETRCED